MGRTQHSARKFSSALRALLAKTFAAILITLFGGSVAISVNATDDEKPLRVYFIDVEGGQPRSLSLPTANPSLLIPAGPVMMGATQTASLPPPREPASPE